MRKTERGKRTDTKECNFLLLFSHPFPEGIGEGEAAAHFACVQVRVRILKNKSKKIVTRSAGLGEENEVRLRMAQC